VEPSDVLSQTLLSIERPRRNRALVGTINFAFLPTRRFGVCSSGIAANLDTRNLLDKNCNGKSVPFLDAGCGEKNGKERLLVVPVPALL